MDDIKQNWDRFQNQMVLLIHLSPRYEMLDIQKAHTIYPRIFDNACSFSICIRLMARNCSLFICLPNQLFFGQ